VASAAARRGTGDTEAACGRRWCMPAPGLNRQGLPSPFGWAC